MKWIVISLLFIACNTKNNKDVTPILSSYLESKSCSDFYVFNDSMIITLTENYSPTGRPAKYCEFYIDITNKKTVETKNCFVDSVHIPWVQNEDEVELDHPVLKHAKLDYNNGSRGYISNTAIIFTDKDNHKVCTFDMYSYDNARISHLYNYKNYLIVLGANIYKSNGWTWLYVYDLNEFVD